MAYALQVLCPAALYVAACHLDGSNLKLTPVRSDAGAFPSLDRATALAQRVEARLHSRVIPVEVDF